MVELVMVLVVVVVVVMVMILVVMMPVVMVLVVVVVVVLVLEVMVGVTSESRLFLASPVIVLLCFALTEFYRCCQISRRVHNRNPEAVVVAGVMASCYTAASHTALQGDDGIESRAEVYREKTCSACMCVYWRSLGDSRAHIGTS